MTELFHISLEDVHLYGYHGVFPQERAVGAEYRVWIDLSVPVPPGCITDSLEGTVSYADVYEVLVREFEVPSALLEHLVYRFTHRLKSRWPQILASKVKIMKAAPPIPRFQGSASVTYEVNY